jgi:predicted nucleic-acid-binding protein
VIGLDTNVLVRYLTQDDPRQSAAASRLIDEELTPAQPGFISLVVLVELGWVLRRLYGATEAELADTAADLLASPQFHVENRAVVQATVQHFRLLKSKVSWTDQLIAHMAKASGCSRTVTFDKAAVRTAGMQLLA